MPIAFTISLIVYMLAMYLIGYLASRRVNNVDDYVVAGRSLPLSLTTVTMVATWFGAESLMTTTDQVAASGIRGALSDPIGIALCLVLTGLFVAGPVWNSGTLTIPDFFRVRYGKLAEILCSLILVPSYFGWIAAQFLALATILSQIYGGPLNFWVIIVAFLGIGYSLMGGMWSITLTDAVQLVLIIVGLVLLGSQILWELGSGWMGNGFQAVLTETPKKFWRFTDPESFSADVLKATSLLAISALGNLPVQDLIQRICSAKSVPVARWSCFLAAFGYFAMGLLPILAGLSAGLILADVPKQGVLTQIASRVLSPGLSLVFLLAIVSAVLSTMVSAVMAPASVLAHNLCEPFFIDRSSTADAAMQADRRLKLQRWCMLVVTSASVALAIRGQAIFELVQGAYAMSLVAMFVPFMVGLYFQRTSALAANASMVVGISSWFVHEFMGWENFAQPWLAPSYEIPHELIDTTLSACAFGIASIRLAPRL